MNKNRTRTRTRVRTRDGPVNFRQESLLFFLRSTFAVLNLKGNSGFAVHICSLFRPPHEMHVFFLETSGCKSRQKSHNNMRYETKKPNNTFHARLRKHKSTLLVTLAETCTRALVYGCMHVYATQHRYIFCLKYNHASTGSVHTRITTRKHDQCYCYWLLVTSALANNDTANATDDT